MNKIKKYLYKDYRDPMSYVIFDGTDEEFENITDFNRKEWRMEIITWYNSRIAHLSFAQLHRPDGPSQVWANGYCSWSIEGLSPNSFFKSMFPLDLFEQNYPDPYENKRTETK